MIDTIFSLITYFALFGCFFCVFSLTVLSPTNLAKKVLKENKWHWLWHLSCYRRTFIIFTVFFLLVCIFIIVASSVENYEQSAVIKILFSGLTLNLLATAIYETLHTSSESYRNCLFNSLINSTSEDIEQREIVNENRIAILEADKKARKNAINKIIKKERDEIKMQTRH